MIAVAMLRHPAFGRVVGGTGIILGRALVAAVEAWAAARGLDEPAVRSDVTRLESHPFHSRLGYVRAKTQHAYRKRLEPQPRT